ncbi:MAG: bifunctional glutamate N-acetyltransferase/amino-acid acetyltransferase ArgJ [Dehalococcoidia bacterium]|nr:bifunctional glutamate N-acetyltransferase/amino-acid acetyltransferase ArgJ [Dehalococcoidia bacterium]
MLNSKNSSPFKQVPDGTVTSPTGFQAGAVYSGLKTEGEGKLDLGILYSEAPCAAAGVFTTTSVRAASVRVCARHIAGGKAQAVVVNAGIANAYVGEQGVKDAEEICTLVGRKLGIGPGRVLIASTGLTGMELPMGIIRRAIPGIPLSVSSGHDLARAIMTTDRRPKEVAVSFKLGGKAVTLGGIAKGAGMIHPNMATMLVFLTTDAAVERRFLQAALRDAADSTFNMLTIDGDTSPSDTLVLLANGAAGNKSLSGDSPDADVFRAALTEVCAFLAKAIARDGEGAEKMIEVTVDGAASQKDARDAARTIAGSTLVKAAVHGNDPNWGRVIAALGRSSARVVEQKLMCYINGICVLDEGKPIPFFREAAVKAMTAPEVSIRVSLNLGDASATAWGCDLTEEYVTFNSKYTT